MKTFLQWAESTNKDLEAVLTDVEPPKGARQDEKGIRTGLGPFYPPAYKHGQYADEYFPPRKATALVDLQNIKKQKVVKDAGNAPT